MSAWRRMRSRVRGPLLHGCALIGGCALAIAACSPHASSPAPLRPLALPMPAFSEFDPVGLLLEQRDALRLTDGQTEAFRSIRRELREAARADLARLDSVNAATGWRLRQWMASGRGDEAFGRRRRQWPPKLPPAQHALVMSLLGCVRATTGGAMLKARSLLDDDQRRVLDTLATRGSAARALRPLSPDGREDWRTPPSAFPCAPAR